MTPLRWVAALLVAYLLGSIPFGYVIAKVARKIDITHIGSGHTGGSNVLRAAGLLPGLLTVIFDYSKGYLAVWLAGQIVPEQPLLMAMAGIAVVAGHNWPIFLRFDGGVGTMTTGGAGTMLSAPLASICAGISVVVILVSRYSSVASLAFSVLLALGGALGAVMGWWHWSLIVFALVTGAMSAYRLKANIQRLANGTERKLGQFIPDGKADVE